MTTDPYALPDRADCCRRECRSPASCHAINRCADTLTPEEDRRTFGWGELGGLYGANLFRGLKRGEGWVK